MSSAGECLVPLPWETRNLGMTSFALADAFLARPDEDLLRNVLAEAARRGRIFVQARIAIDSGLSRVLEGCGFYFVEATVCPHTSLAANTALRGFKADPRQFLPARYRKANLEVVLPGKRAASHGAAVRRIAGEAFTTDRFHVDHNCEPGIASRRYQFWIDDLLRDAGVAFDLLLHRGGTIAFMARRAERLLLAGFEKKYVNSGLGEFLWLAAMQHMAGAGMKRADTLVSVNNTASLNLHARIGFKFREPRATFHYWSQPAGSP